jgi:hypothetical protein
MCPWVWGKYEWDSILCQYSQWHWDLLPSCYQLLPSLPLPLSLPPLPFLKQFGCIPLPFLLLPLPLPEEAESTYSHPDFWYIWSQRRQQALLVLDQGKGQS